MKIFIVFVVILSFFLVPTLAARTRYRHKVSFSAHDNADSGSFRKATFDK
ncbi:Venom peptide [Caenorhabditis elegans]|uniref:Venom peptide n=1 Tax=Caenorhabditis elegans TaxID=6239 RepID=W6RR29_CAEEL|nr:Venom peptide [Caenorhabditis elegans]pir/T29360/ hypothetical protein R05G6.3 - Caenorhabditis elegans [Caenorhabditis elegans]CDM63565.1 Venom peptide [Caenorhabditis elegans]|eukprot:NP_001294199.1 Uncharacterized protein CELE_R05G6.3 [Caenorhabditis elegans]